jgi:hypothetical protein
VLADGDDCLSSSARGSASDETGCGRLVGRAESHAALRALPGRGAEDVARHGREMQGQATVFFNGIGFCSISEAVCATMLELYVPGYQVVIGKTFQIDVGSGRTVDFLIHGVLCEYHGVRLVPDRRRFGDFRDRDEYHAYARELHRLRGNEYRRQRHIDETKAKLAQNYFERRRRMLDDHPEYGVLELVVATSIDEFYERVVMRFNPLFCPTRPDFHESFRSFAGIIARQNTPLKRQKRRRQAA